MVSNVMSGPVLGQIVQPRRDRTEHGGLRMPPGSVLSSLSSTLVSPLVATPGVGAGLAPFESQSSDHLFHKARVCFYPKPSGTPSHRSVEDLELLVEIRGFPDHLRLNLVPLFELSDHPLSIFP